MRKLFLQFIVVLFTSSLALAQTVGPTPFGQLNTGFSQPQTNSLTNVTSTPAQPQIASNSVSITAATPGVVSWPGHTLGIGSQIYFQTLGSITGLTTYTTYYVSSAGFGLASFQLSTTYANAYAGISITTGGSNSTSLIAIAPQAVPPGPVNFLTLDQSGAIGGGYDGFSVLGITDVITTGVGITAASPGVVTWASAPFKIGDPVIFTNISTVTGIAINTTYYVSSAGFTPGVSFQISTTLANALAGTSINTTGTTSASGVSGLQPVLFIQDMTGYVGLNLQITSVGGGANIVVETSEDTLNWYVNEGISSSASNGTPLANTFSSAGIQSFQKRARFIRARLSSYTSGTQTISYELTKSTPLAFSGYSLLGGPLWTTSLSPTSAIAVEPAGWTYSHTATAAATTIKSGAGYLHTICINSPLGTGTLTVADATSGTTPTIAIITTTGTAALAGSPFCQTYDILFATGLTITDATEAQDVTVSFK